MKKIILFFAAVLAMYSCSNEETFYPIETQQAASTNKAEECIAIHVSKNPHIFGAYSINFYIGPYSGTSTHITDIEYELASISYETSGDIFVFRKDDSILNGDFYGPEGPCMIQAVNDFIIPAGTTFPHRITILINPDLTSNITSMQFLGAEFKARYNGEESIISIDSNLNSREEYTYSEFSTPHANYILEIQTGLIYLN